MLLLERGDWLAREPQNWQAHDVFVANRYVSADTWYDERDKAFQPQVHYCVGGATKLYGAALYRLREEDFGELRHHDGISPAWPIDYAEMEPYYSLAEQRYEVHGARGEDPTEPPAVGAVSVSRGQPRAPHPAALRRPGGRRAPAVPRAVRRPPRRARHAAQPLRALRHLRRLPVPGAREVRRRGARRPAALEHAEVTLMTNAEAVRLETDADGSAVTGVVVDHAGERETFTGDLVVVSCGAANSARLLLASASDAHPAGLANGSGQVGRNYMFHNSQAVLALSKEENPTVFQKTLGLNDFYFGSPDFEYPLGNIQMVGKSSAEMYRGEKPIQTRLAPGADARPGRPPRGRLLALDRGPAAARKPRHVARRRRDQAQLHAEQRGAEAAPAARAQVAAGAPRHAPRPPAAAARLPQERHPGGGLRAPGGHLPLRDRSRASVLNTDCRAHEVDNLYVVDTSFFPSIGAVNPALTAMANALRVGDHLLERMGAARPEREPEHVA